MGVGHNASQAVPTEGGRGMAEGATTRATTTTDATTDNTVANTMSAAHVRTRKSPPPEKPEAIRLRTWVIASFWTVILLLGLPVWWKTTSIYRAELPLQEIASWASGTACSPVYPLQIWIYAPSVPCAEARHFVQTTQHALDDLNEFPTHHLRLRLVDSHVLESENRSSASQDCTYPGADEGVKQGRGPSLSLHLQPDGNGQTPRLETEQFSTNAKLSYATNQLPSLSSSSSPLTTYIATELHSLFLEEQASIAHILASQDSLPNASQSQRLLKSLPRSLVDSVAHRSSHALKFASTYHLTFSLFSAGANPSSWDVSEALKEHIQPWLTGLSSTYNFNVNTQVQLYASFSPSVYPRHDSVSNTTTLVHDDLSAFVNAAEWPLSPSLGSPAGPTINFVLYVPTPSQVPLTIADTAGKTSWIIPQWGGISILNPPVTLSPETQELTLPSHLSSSLLSSAFSTFTSQLLTLLAIPPPTPSPNPLPLPLRLQQTLHTRLLSTYLRTLSSLTSLSHLTHSHPEIPIPRTVSSSVALSLSRLQSTCTLMHDSRFPDAMSSVVVAEREAEKAFFEKSMVGQAYFPEEHKVAVYLPLLGPVGVPLLVGLVKEVKRGVGGWRERRRRGG